VAGSVKPSSDLWNRPNGQPCRPLPASAFHNNIAAPQPAGIPAPLPHQAVSPEILGLGLQGSAGADALHRSLLRLDTNPRL